VVTPSVAEAGGDAVQLAAHDVGVGELREQRTDGVEDRPAWRTDPSGLAFSMRASSADRS
jgi:hypothetical protein